MEHMVIKEKAIEFMERLGMLEQYIQAFRERGTVHLFEGFLGSPVNTEISPEILEKVKEIERRENVIVYAVTHEHLYGAEFYSFLVLSNYPEDWELMLQQYSANQFRIYAYVWNVHKEWCSEFGSIVVQTFVGGIVRVG